MIRVLSPHFDDAAWSLGGSIARWARDRRTGGVEVITVFTASAPPSETRGPAALAMEARWGLGSDPLAARAVEDERAMALLGARRRVVGFRDVVYRRPDVAAEAILGTEPEPGLVDRVAEAVEVSLGPGDLLVVPRGLGGHLDHVACALAGLAVAEHVGCAVELYDEFPYLFIDTTGAVGADWPAIGGRFGAGDALAKVRASAAYASQVADTWGHPARMVRSMLRAGVLWQERRRTPAGDHVRT